jgi:hypothetical protein
VVYSVYGLNLDSDLPLPGAAPAAGQPADVTFTLAPFSKSLSNTAAGETVWYESEWTDEATGARGLTIHRSTCGAFRICYCDGVEFAIDADGRRIVGRAPSAASLADVACYVTGPVLGFVLRLRGVVALHASAVDIGRKAILFVGDARSGKSTTAAMLARMGYKVITEDVAALSIVDDGLSVHAGCAEVALRPDAVELMYGSAEALPRFSDTWDKRRFDLMEIGAFSAGAVPLGGVYLLTNTGGIPDAPCVVPVTSGEAMVELLANVYGNRLFHHELRLRELDTVHHVVGSVPVKVAATGAEQRLLERFCEVLLDDLL